MRKFSFIFLLIFITGCTTAERINNELSKRTVAYEQYFKKAKVEPLENRVIIIADNQFNNIYTDPTVLRNFYADSFAEVSIRPPQVDIFSPQLFKWTLQKYNAKDNFVIHLGDALNIACSNEWSIFEKSLESVDRDKFVMALGNHDFYWYGVTDGEYKSDKIDWAMSCDDRYPISNKNVDDSKRFTKGKFINKYLKFVDIGYIPNTTKRYFTKKGKSAFIQEIFVKRFKGERDEYSSFLVQRINIPSEKSNKKGLGGIVIDTGAYTKKPLNVLGHLKIAGHYNPGEIGQLTQPQRKIIEEWSNKFKNKKEPFMIFGHHPIKALNSKDKIWIENLIENNSYALGYISAHTHLGFVDNKTKGLVEVNVGSITDYPNEIRTLSVNPVKGELKSTLYPISPNKLDNTPWCDSLYDYTSSYPDNYLSYQFARRGIYSAHYAHEATLNISISTYLRLFDDLQVIQYFADNEKMLDEYINIISTAKKERKKDCFKQIREEDIPNLLLYSLDNKAFASSVDCRSGKLKILKKMDKFNQKIEKLSEEEYVNNLMLYGSCQTLISSKAEWIGNYSNSR